MFTTFIVQPIFNLLALIYALLPGHNFGLSIIIFTIIVRLALWPLVRKQLHQAKLLRELQPELKKIKAQTKGNRTKEQAMMMELYKERGVNPIGSIGILIPQFIILIGLYNGLHKVVTDPQQIVSFAYPFVQHIGWMQQLATNIKQFDETLFGFVDLTRSANGPSGLYLPALIIVLLSSAVQYYQSKMLLPIDKNARKLRDILRSAGDGKAADQSEVQAAVSRTTIYLLPVLIFVVTIGLPAALGLYWLVGGAVAIVQQTIILRSDETEMEAIADEPSKKNIKNIPEAEVVAPVAVSPKPKAKKNKKKAKKAVNDSMDEAVLYSKKYLEDMLSFFGLNTDVHATNDDEVIQLNVPSTHMNGFLIGQRGDNVRSLQYLVSTALKNNNYAYTRVNVDVAEYKKQRADRLREKAETWVKQVKDSGESMDLQPMNAADRRVVHQLAAEFGLTSESAGEGRDRHIVLKITEA